jgi:hypothetical protein
MPPKKGTRPWIPVPIAWEGVRVSEDGRHLLVAYVTGNGQPADRADVRWDQSHVTLTLSRMRTGSGDKLMAFHHCVEVPLSQDAWNRILIDGATGERASAKRSRYPDPDVLRGSESSLDAYFGPTEMLEPREISV